MRVEIHTNQDTTRMSVDPIIHLLPDGQVKLTAMVNNTVTEVTLSIRECQVIEHRNTLLKMGGV